MAMRGIAWSAVACLACLAGCAPDNGLKMGRVSGKITYRGEPVEDGQILFAPDEAKGTVGVPAMAKIASDGSYSLSTQDPGDGAIVGFHRVGVRGIDPTPVEASGKEQAAQTGKDIFAARAKAAKTRRRPSTVSGKEETITINSKVYHLTTPAKLANPNESGILVEVFKGGNRVDLDIQEDGSVKVTR
jgi:hypothetical protein